MISNEDAARLHRQPVWVQDLVNRQNRRITELRGHVEALQAKDAPDSNALLDPNSDYSVRLKRNPTIRYDLDDTGYLEVRFDGRKLTVHGSGPSAWHNFAVLPEVSNSVSIQFFPPVTD